MSVPVRWNDWEALLREYRGWRESRRASSGRTRTDINRCLEFVQWARVLPSEVTHELLMGYSLRPRRWSTSEAQAAAEVNAVVRVLDFGRGIEDPRPPAYMRPAARPASPPTFRPAALRDTPASPDELVPTVAELEDMLEPPAAIARPVIRIAESQVLEEPLDVSSGLTWEHLLATYSMYALSAGLATSTLNGYLTKCRTFASRTLVSPAAVTPETVASYLGRDGIAVETMKSDRVSLRAVFRYAVERKLLPTNPVDGTLVAALSTPEPGLMVGSAVESHRVRRTAGAGLGGVQVDAAMLAVHPARSWAQSQGYRVGEVGNLAPDLLKAWRAAGSPVVVPTSDALIAAWDALLVQYGQAARAAGRSARTVRHRAMAMRTFARWSQTLPGNVTAAQLRLYLSNPNWSPETRRSKRAAFVVVFRFARREGLVQVDPAAELENVRVPGAVPRPVPEPVLAEAVAAAEDDGRMRLMLLLGSLQGLRAEEIARLRAENVTAEGLRVTGKGGKTRLLPIHPDLAGELARYVGRTGWLFPSPDSERPLTANHVSKLIARALPGKWTAHTLRHRFGSQAFAGTKDIRAVQMLLGHSSPAVTARYIAVPAGELIAAVNAVPTIGAVLADDALAEGTAIADEPCLGSPRPPEAPDSDIPSVG